MPQIGPFGDAVAAHDTSDVTPVTLRRWTAGTSRVPPSRLALVIGLAGRTTCGARRRP